MVYLWFPNQEARDQLPEEDNFQIFCYEVSSKWTLHWSCCTFFFLCVTRKIRVNDIISFVWPIIVRVFIEKLFILLICKCWIWLNQLNPSCWVGLNPVKILMEIKLKGNYISNGKVTTQENKYVKNVLCPGWIQDSLV